MHSVAYRMRMAAREHADTPWRVRVCTGAGDTVGAGVLLGDRLVLTCAHVVRNAGLSGDGPAGQLRIDSVVCQPRWSTPARVLPGCWISERSTQRGDVALLALDTPVTCHAGARLRQAPVRDVAVRTCGFPDGGKIGIWAEGRLAGASYDGEWVEMHALRQDRGQWVTRGFSGAGVTTAGPAGGDVTGIVVAVRETGSSVNAWMMPAETIAGYLPQVRPFLDGGPTSDLPSVGLPAIPLQETAVDIELRREISRLFSGVWSGTAVITGGRREAGAPWLARLVATADPAARGSLPDPVIAAVPRDANLGVGAVDLAVDAGGLTSREVRRRIAERFGLPGDGTGALADDLLMRLPPPAMVIDRVDSSADPARLISDLLTPLAAGARRRGLRLVLGFAGEPPGDLPHEISLGPEPLPPTAPGPAPRAEPSDPPAVWRLLVDLAAAERELAPLYADVSARVAGIPDLPPSRAPRLRVRYAASAGRVPTPELSVLHDRAQTALAEVRELTAALGERKQKRTGLIEALRGYRELAERCFGAEDRELSPLYQSACDILRSGPCNLATAQELVDRYIDAVRRRRGRDQEGEA